MLSEKIWCAPSHCTSKALFLLIRELTQDKLFKRSRVSKGLETLIFLLEATFQCVCSDGFFSLHLVPTCGVKKSCCVYYLASPLYVSLSHVCLHILFYKVDILCRSEMRDPPGCVQPPSVCLSSWVARFPPSKSLLWLSSPAFYVSAIPQPVSS